MQKINQQQIKTIAKEIVKLSKDNTPIKHSSVLEVISKSLGYRDYNALNNKLDKEKSLLSKNIDNNSVNKESEEDRIIAAIDNIEEEIDNIEKELKFRKNTLFEKEIQRLNEELHVQRYTLNRVQSKTTESEIDRALAAIHNINEKLESEKNTLSEKETQKLKEELKAQRIACSDAGKNRKKTRKEERFSQQIEQFHKSFRS